MTLYFALLLSAIQVVSHSHCQLLSHKHSPTDTLTRTATPYHSVCLPLTLSHKHSPTDTIRHTATVCHSVCLTLTLSVIVTKTHSYGHFTSHCYCLPFSLSHSHTDSYCHINTVLLAFYLPLLLPAIQSVSLYTVK